jgi:hypothetical protein
LAFGAQYDLRDQPGAGICLIPAPLDLSLALFMEI